MAPRLATVRSAGGATVCERCLLADSPWLRMKGLLGRRELPAGEGILLRPASSIHMLFMRFPIDAVFLSRDLTVLRIAADLAPWRLAAKRGAHAVLELPAGTAAGCGLREGERLVLQP
ncbi:MAG TPA: DUF192 domain-containing protein [Gaiellaceae bacterium]|nr:DUF192 domain-containing protein [Gaiellaceae bacterium]